MAPWPEQGNEPKAPDKNSDKCDNITLEEEETAKVEATENSDSGVQPSKPDQNIWNNCESGQFHNFDEGQLKALLEEAITYKNPKDRESKSVLFKELLQEVEADESDCSDETVVTNTGSSGSARSHLAGSRFSSSRKRHGKKDPGVAERQRSGGSLQNLVHAIRGTSSRPGRDHVTGSVSARQREGGSLPTNVNVQGVDTDDVNNSTELVYNYTSRATLQVSEEPHHVDMAVSFPISSKQASNTINGVEQAPLQLHSSYNSVKCVMGSNSEAKNTNNVVSKHTGNKRERAAPSRPQVESSCNSSAMSMVDGNPKANSLPSDKPLYFVPLASWTRQGEYICINYRDLNRIPLTKESSVDKKVDENGNAVGSTAKVDTTTPDRKGKRRLKMKNYRNIVPAEKIEGHRGEDNIDSLLQYIESSPSPAGNTVETNKTTRTRQANGPVALVNKNTRSVNKVRAKEEENRKRRAKETKIHKSNSLEEISKTKLEDLTSPSSNQDENIRARPKKQVTLDDAQLHVMSLGNKNNLCDEPLPKRDEDSVTFDEGGDFNDGKKKRDKKLEFITDSSPGNEFHLVQKKQRRKKRQVPGPSRSNSGKVESSGCYGGRGFSTHDRVERDSRSLYRYRHNAGPQKNLHPRRKSASSVPPSDNSDCSDEGSVCSLPVSSTTPRPNVGKTSTSGGSTPQASYADIARSVASPPRTACPVVPLTRRMTPTSTVPSSAASSGVGDEDHAASPEPICTKKDAMTDTNLDSYLPIEEYPPLKGASSDVFVEYTLKRGRSNRESSVSVDETVIVKNNTLVNNEKDNQSPDSVVSVSVEDSFKAPAPVSLSTKRPPVLLPERPSSSARLPLELTFGFEVNQKLLKEKGGSEPEPEPVPEPEPEPVPVPVPVSESESSPPCVNPSLESMVNYFRTAWDAVMVQHQAQAVNGETRVQYYSEQ